MRTRTILHDTSEWNTIFIQFVEGNYDLFGCGDLQSKRLRYWSLYRMGGEYWIAERYDFSITY